MKKIYVVACNSNITYIVRAKSKQDAIEKAVRSAYKNYRLCLYDYEPEAYNIYKYFDDAVYEIDFSNIDLIYTE